MGPTDNRRVFKDLAEQLSLGQDLIEEQRVFLAFCFRRIADGEDANVVLGLKHKQGQSEADAAARRSLSVLLHMVASHVEEGVRIETACSKVAEIAQRLPLGSEQYDADYLRKCWYKYPHMRSLERSIFDPDFPYKL